MGLPIQRRMQETAGLECPGAERAVQGFAQYLKTGKKIFSARVAQAAAPETDGMRYGACCL